MSNAKANHKQIRLAIKDVREWARKYITCQWVKVTKPNKTSVENFKGQVRRFEHVHIDIVGPLPISREYKYCLTCIDRCTRWVEAVPIINNNDSDSIPGMMDFTIWCTAEDHCGRKITISAE